MADVDSSGVFSSPPASSSKDLVVVVVTRSNGRIDIAILMTLDLCCWNSMP